MARWEYIPSRALGAPDVCLYMPTHPETNLLLYDVSFYSAFPVKTIFLLLFSVRYSFSPSRTAGWFLASIPSGLEAKTVGATNWSWHKREGGLWCSEFSGLRLAFMPWSSLVFIPAAFLEGRCCAHSFFLTGRRKMNYLKEKVWLPYGTAIALLPNLEIYVR